MYRLLEVGEKIIKGDEYHGGDGYWYPSPLVGGWYVKGDLPVRRAAEIAEAQPTTPTNTGSLQCFNKECPALWYDHFCTSSKFSECSARVETQQASA
jgi:hypothetical protein